MLTVASPPLTWHDWYHCLCVCGGGGVLTHTVSQSVWGDFSRHLPVRCPWLQYSLFTREGRVSASLGSFLIAFGSSDVSDSDAGAGSPSEPGGLQGATRHLKECGQATSYPGDSWSAQGPANKMLHLGGSPLQWALGVSGLPLTSLPLPAALQLLTSFHRRLQNPLSKKMHMGSCINCSTDNELLLTLLVLDSFLNQEYRLDFSVSHLPREIFFFLRTWVLESLRLVFEAQLCHLLSKSVM